MCSENDKRQLYSFELLIWFVICFILIFSRGFAPCSVLKPLLEVTYNHEEVEFRE